MNCWELNGKLGPNKQHFNAVLGALRLVFGRLIFQKVYNKKIKVFTFSIQELNPQLNLVIQEPSYEQRVKLLWQQKKVKCIHRCLVKFMIGQGR